MASMKAVRIHRYGGPEELTYEDAPRPTAGDGEVLIRVHATSVNPFDAAMRAGYMAAYFRQTLPMILGTDVSGIVEDVGIGVTQFARGDSVYTRAGVSRDGAYAEYAVAPAADVATKPKSIDHLRSAAIPHVMLTSWQALIELAQLSEGQTVLIHGAGGGVGHMAAQLAKLRGARVIGTASVNIDFLRKLGVDEAINYATTPFEQVVHDVDVVLDLIGGDTQERSWSVLKPGGILISTVQPPSEEKAAAHGVRQYLVSSAPPIGKTLTEVAAMVDAGQIVPEVSKTFPLAAIREAHESIAGKHTRGKIGLQVVDSA
jgi:NADPH:quinone reductase-like Zn-dependent oxidoreductase